MIQDIWSIVYQEQPSRAGTSNYIPQHDDVIKWKHFPRNWPFVREIHRSPVNFPHKGQWRGALMFSLIYAWINDWVNNREAGDLRRQHGHYDVIVMDTVGCKSLAPALDTCFWHTSPHIITIRPLLITASHYRHYVTKLMLVVYTTGDMYKMSTVFTIILILKNMGPHVYHWCNTHSMVEGIYLTPSCHRNQIFFLYCF